MSRLGLGWSGPYVVGRLGLGIWVSASFHSLALTAAKCPRWEGNCPGGDISGEGMCSRGDVQGEMSYTLKSITHLLAATGKLLTAIQ